MEGKEDYSKKNQRSSRRVHLDTRRNRKKDNSKEPGPSHGVRFNTGPRGRNKDFEQPGTSYVDKSKSQAYRKRVYSEGPRAGSSKPKQRRYDLGRPTFSSSQRGPINLRAVEDLLNNSNLEDVILNITAKKCNFEETLSKEMTDDMVVLMTKLLSRVCESNFDSMKLSIIQMALSSHFTDHLTKFIAGIAIQGSQEKRRNVHFWNNPDNFWDSLVIMIRNIHELVPTSSCEVLLKIVKMMNIYIPVIELNQTMSFPNEIKEKITTLCQDVQNTIDHMETEQVVTDSTRDPDALPNDFRKLPIYPSTNEVTEPSSPFLRPNIIEGPYQSVEHYLDVQFRLNREDFVAPLREGICKFINNPRDKWENIKVYRGVKFVSEELLNEQICYLVKFNMKNNTDYSRTFMFGSLLCFTKDNFATIIFGKVVDRDKKYLEKGQIKVGFDPEITLLDSLCEGEYLMIESTIYFEPYYHVLKKLQTIEPQDFPLERSIIQVETQIKPPAYLLGTENIMYQIGETFNPLEWGKRRFFDLNHAQQEAFKAALTQDLALIQGPPGTGKTFLGLKIAKTLLHNSHAWYENSPMLIVCYTNHALDQFLEGLLPMELIRVGGQSKNKQLNNYNLKNKRGYTRSDDELKSIRKEIGQIKILLELIERNQVVIGFHSFQHLLPNNVWFSYADRESIWRWLCYEDGEIIDDDDYYDHGNVREDIGVDIDQITKECIINIKDFDLWIEQSEMELREIENNKKMRRWEKFHLQNEMTYYINLLKEDKAYLKMRFQQSKSFNADNLPDFVDYINPYAMPLDSRWHFYYYWLKKYVGFLHEQRENLKKEFQEEYKIHEELKALENVEIMKKARVIGMTTTMAARLSTSLKTLKSPIVIIEEAAEVLESHIVCSLTSHCKHLILIGDHKQLRPTTASFKIETKYKLGISLFERMINNKLPYQTLNIQHRMRPEISSLICPTIYPDLIDHESVMKRRFIRGIEKPVYFIDHKEQEMLCNDSSKKNVHEAELLLKLARHLIFIGYNPGSITILAAYLGQMFEMQKIQSGSDSTHLKDVRIAVLDNYQGEECDIILLSLVRSNREDRIGFLKNENRVCVALSRAKLGFYMMGNMTLLANNSKIWPKIKCTLEKMDAIGPYLPLNCPEHTDNITKIYKAADFTTCMEGGCNLKCDTPLPCGHHCRRLCHLNDRNHRLYRCRQIVERQLSCQHVCKMECYKDPATHKCEILLENVKLPCEHFANKLCHEQLEKVQCNQPCYHEVEPCGHLCDRQCHLDDRNHELYRCRQIVERQLPCQHSCKMKCYKDPATHKCRILLENVKLPCEHFANKLCYEEFANVRCNQPCEYRVEPCGHSCIRKCHFFDDPDHLKYDCPKPCEKMLSNCSTPNGEAHKCDKQCFVECSLCHILVAKKRSCSHVLTVECHRDVEKMVCLEPCLKMLNCGHKCQKKCDDPCGDCAIKVEKVIPDCEHKVTIKCSKEPTRKRCHGKCPRLLSCGHPCTGQCCETCTEECSIIVDCEVEAPCGHILKKLPCFLTKKADSKILLPYCDEKCDTLLRCGHKCTGSCVDCFQGRFHQRCQEKCGSVLVCNHACQIACNVECKPCTKKCEYRCPHSRCSRRCGDLCSPCKESCTRRCSHQKCSKRCSDFCNVPPCNIPCDKIKKCGHTCIGFCGEPCPSLCRVCDKDKLTEIFLGNEDKEDAIYVMLDDCKHIFEAEDMVKWLEMDNNEIKAKVCPRCKTSIKTTMRYSDYIKRNTKDIMKVKEKYYGPLKENEKLRLELLSKVPQYHPSVIKHIIQGKTHTLCKYDPNTLYNKIYNSFRLLKESLQELKKIGKTYKRQTCSRADLNSIQSKIQILNMVLEGYKKIESIPSCSAEENLNFVINVLMREDGITEQEIQDLTLEIKRFTRLIQFEELYDKGRSYFTTHIDEKNKYENLKNTLKRSNRYADEIDNTIEIELAEMAKLVNTTISEMERIEIVRAIGMSPGHWFKCPNGHPYVIGECGGAMQVSTCPECKVPIGGTAHRLLSGQEHAPEMDNSRHPAWSEAANMANYQI